MYMNTIFMKTWNRFSIKIHIYLYKKKRKNNENK